MLDNVLIRVKKAKYYEKEQSIVIVGEEVETKRTITQQITLRAFLMGIGLFSPFEVDLISNDSDRCRYLAEQIEKRKEPISLKFDPEGEIE